MLSRYLHPHRETAYLMLRVGAGLMFAFHGAQKILGVLATSQPMVGTQIWFGGIIELVAGSAIAVGALTSVAAFLASGTMAVAYIQFHWSLALGANFFPGINKGELAVVYSLVFLYVACRGAGKWSVDERSRRPGARS